MELMMGSQIVGLLDRQGEIGIREIYRWGE
jgi:hypothetical protein